jgi:hypothetical protein
MRVVRLSFALAVAAAAAACGGAIPTAPATSVRAATVHRNEGFLGSGNNVTNPAPTDTVTTSPAH